VSPRHVPTKDEALESIDRLLKALEANRDINDAIDEIRPLHPRYNTFPGEIFMRIAADGLEEGGVDRSHPISQELVVEKYLPECKFRGRENGKIRYALLAAAATHAGIEVDLLEEVSYWGTDDYWQYAALATAAWIRAVSDQRALSLPELCLRLRARAADRLADY
jgi:hypothetical protein